jgi:ribosomal protein RSM22 (predicted rRNA methylase)
MGGVPTTLSRALEGLLEGFGTAPLRSATAELVEVYRSGAPPTELVLGDPLSAAAYAAYRMPATHAAVSRALLHAIRAEPTLDVRTVLDVGGGTGAASWAVAEAFPGVERVEVLDGSAAALDLGQRLAREGPPAVAAAAWTHARLEGRLRPPPSDLAVMSYVLGELREEAPRSVLDTLIPISALVLVVEPGTPRGYAAVLAARSRLVETGWHLLVPCPQDGPCPLGGSDDWCHFSARLDRSSLHRRLKGGALGHEDEKFSYVLASRDPVSRRAAARVLRHPMKRKGLVQLEVCRPDATAGRVVVTRRDPTAYRTARDVVWGDALPAPPG